MACGLSPGTKYDVNGRSFWQFTKDDKVMLMNNAFVAYRDTIPMSVPWVIIWGLAVKANRTALHAWEKWTIRNISTPPPSGNWKAIVTQGELTVDQTYYSNNSQYRLTTQNDGNLVLCRSDNTPVWHSHTYGSSGSRCHMQGDGNLVIYNPQGQPIWHTHTYGNVGIYLQISNDDRIRIRRNNQMLWQS